MSTYSYRWTIPVIQQLTRPPELTRSTGNLAAYLVASAAKYEKKQAIVFGGTATTYGELLDRTNAVALQLEALGLGKGDRVALLFPNTPDFVSCFFAVVGIGGIVVPVNPLLKAEEIEHILCDSGAKALIVHAGCLTEAKAAINGTSSLLHVIVSSSARESVQPELPARINVHQLTAERRCGLSVVPKTDTSGDDLALIVYTSGTTGKPKGALLTNGNIASVMPVPLLAGLNADHNDRWLAMLPLCHIYGLGVIVFSTIALGATVAILEKFDPALALSVIEREKITLVPAVPSMYQFMLMELSSKSYELSSVRICFSGAAALSTDLLEQIEVGFGAPVVEGYALSETSCGATINPINARKTGTVGKALNGLEIAIYDEDGTVLPRGAEHVGEIAVKGPNIMRGYHNQPEATAEVLRDGWFFTGDLGVCDEDGYISIVGRKKELIIRGGQNIYPREVEDVIARMAGVREVSVIGVPDSYMGERVKAIVVCTVGNTVTEETVKEFCSDHLAPYKVPRLVEFRDEPLPRNSTGKVLKRLLS